MRTSDHWVIRRATPRDAEALARVHVASWQETYGDLLPPRLLARYSVAVRRAMWERILDEGRVPDGNTVLVTQSNADIVGFGSCGPQRSEQLRSLGLQGEILGLYVLQAAQGHGAGSALMGALMRQLHQDGCSACGLWVLRDNLPARQFYERRGGKVVADKEDARDAFLLQEVAYGWSGAQSP